MEENTCKPHIGLGINTQNVQRTPTEWFHLQEAREVVEFIETEAGKGLRGGSCC